LQLLKAKQVSVWADKDEEREQPVMFVVYHWTYPKGPKGPQDFMVVLNMAGEVVRAKPVYSVF